MEKIIIFNWATKFEIFWTEKNGEKDIRNVLNVFKKMEKKITLGWDTTDFCKPDSKGLTSNIREPVGLSLNPPSGACGPDGGRPL